MNKANRNAPSIFYISLLLLTLTLFSIHMTSGLYARYTTSTSGFDNARVAAFDVNCQTESGEPLSIMLDFFDPSLRTDSIEFYVISSSEVAVKYDICIILPNKMAQWLDSGLLQIHLLNGSADGKIAPKAFDLSSGTVTFDGEYLEASSLQKYHHTLVFTIPVGAMPGEIININEGATLRIHAEQID